MQRGINPCPALADASVGWLCRALRLVGWTLIEDEDMDTRTLGTFNCGNLFAHYRFHSGLEPAKEGGFTINDVVFDISGAPLFSRDLLEARTLLEGHDRCPFTSVGGTACPCT